MSYIEKLLLISSDALAARPVRLPQILQSYPLGQELFEMLQRKNGFFAFESALHVLPLTDDPNNGLEGWNADSLWRKEYQDLSEGLFFFAEDIFQDQFCFSEKKTGVFRFMAESGKIDWLAESLEKWAERILTHHRVETGWPLAREWQEKHGPLKPGQRLMPKIPFFMGGEYSIENLWAGNPLEGMRFKADLAVQTRHLPSGSKVKLNIRPKPNPE